MNQDNNNQWIVTLRRPLDLALSSLGGEEWNLIDAVCGNPATVEPKPPSRPLSALEKGVLRDGGACLPEPDEGKESALLAESESHLFAACRAVIEASLTEAEVAALLGLFPSQVRSLALNKPPKLHMFELNSTPLYPCWQFDAEGAIPHLGALLAVLNDSGGLPPLTLHRLMILPTEDFETKDDRPISPRDFLVQRYDPAPLLSMVSSINIGM
ncbi:hypothetical protein [Marinobacter alkaliphilus]|uniref:hypothetical protein n=1 Tax=Marinobacter alkaliphilus TaxID=254719 RepID=UPI003D76674C